MLLMFFVFVFFSRGGVLALVATELAARADQPRIGSGLTFRKMMLESVHITEAHFATSEDALKRALGMASGPRKQLDKTPQCLVLGQTIARASAR